MTFTSARNEVLVGKAKNPSMRMISKLPRVAVILLAACLPTLRAQQKSPGEMEIRLLAFTPDLQRTEAFAHDPAAQDTTASVPTPIKSYLNHEFSKVTTQSRRLVFTTKSDRPSMTRPGELIGEVTLPEKTSSALLVFLPGKKDGKAICQILAINDSRQAFPAGSFHTMNLSGLPVKLTLENKPYDFPPGATVLIENPPVREGHVSGMRAFVKQGETWDQVATGLWPHPGQSRGIKLFYQNPASGKIQLRAFDDVAPRAPKEVAGAAPAP